MRYLKALFGKYDHEWTNGPQTTLGKHKYLFGNDWHLYSKYCDNPALMDLLDKWLELGFPEDLYFLGDIFDFACMPKDRVESAQLKFKNVMEEMKDRYIFGNHEREGLGSVVKIITSKANGRKYALVHYDLQVDATKGNHKWRDYRFKPQGASWLSLIKTSLLDSMDWLKARRPLPKGFIEHCASYCRDLGVDGIVGGHFHVEAERRYYFEDKEIIVLPAHKLNEVWL